MLQCWPLNCVFVPVGLCESVIEGLCRRAPRVQRLMMRISREHCTEHISVAPLYFHINNASVVFKTPNPNESNEKVWITLAAVSPVGQHIFHCCFVLLQISLVLQSALSAAREASSVPGVFRTYLEMFLHLIIICSGNKYCSLLWNKTKLSG